MASTGRCKICGNPLPDVYAQSQCEDCCGLARFLSALHRQYIESSPEAIAIRAARVEIYRQRVANNEPIFQEELPHAWPENHPVAEATGTSRVWINEGKKRSGPRVYKTRF